MPIRIIRFKPPRQEQLLREVAEKLKDFMAGIDSRVLFGEPRVATLPYFNELERCIGCGRFHTFFCPWCRELERLARIKSQKPLSTVEQRFALRRFQDG